MKRGFGLKRHDDADLATILAFFRREGKTVLTFLGFSGTGYQYPERMLAIAGSVLDQYDPAHTIVNIGATEEGIGAVYELAKNRGFYTTGIVSALAATYQVPLSPFVDDVFFVEDTTWGGMLPETGALSPTSEAMVECSDRLVAIGGGAVARDELLAARQREKPVQFFPAEMNHEKAMEKARKKGTGDPDDFQGEAFSVFG